MKVIRIGTRESKLALWQATHVANLLNNLDFDTEIVPIKSEGDIDLITPLYEMGVQGVFTKSLDAALLMNKIDIAVHSMKDVPVVLARGLVQGAVLERGLQHDILVTMGSDLSTFDEVPTTIATGSLRRKAQWLHRYPKHQVQNLRGNVQTRIAKLQDSDWGGAIMAAAGLDRMNITGIKTFPLEWMIPAPAQGAIMIVCQEGNNQLLSMLNKLNHPETEVCTRVERHFLHVLQGGCSAPIGAAARVVDDKILFRGSITSINGEEHIEIEKEIPLSATGAIETIASEVLNEGAGKILQTIRTSNS